MADNPSDWGAVAVEESPSSWGAIPVGEGAAPASKSSEEIQKEIQRVRTASKSGMTVTDSYDFDHTKTGEEFNYDRFRAKKVGEDQFVLTGKPAKQGYVGTFLRSMGMSEPAVASSFAAMGAASRIPGVQALPPWGKTTVALGAGLVGGIAGSVATNKVVESAMPELATQLQRDAASNPKTAALGGLMAQAPFAGVGGGLQLPARALNAGIGLGIAGTQEAIHGTLTTEDGLVRTALAGLGGAAFAKNTGLGEAAMGTGVNAASAMGKGKNFIMDQLGRAKGGAGLSETVKVATDISMAPPNEPPEPPGIQIPPPEGPMSRMLREKDNAPTNAGAAPKVPETKVIVNDPETGTPLTVDAGGPLGDFQPTNPFVPKVLSETEVFNRRVQGIVENLAKEGVEIDRQTAIKLARTTDRTEFNKARQKLIDSIKPPKIPTEGPLEKAKTAEQLAKEQEAAVAPKTEAAPKVEPAPEVKSTAPDFDTQLKTALKKLILGDETPAAPKESVPPVKPVTTDGLEPVVNLPKGPGWQREPSVVRFTDDSTVLAEIDVGGKTYGSRFGNRGLEYFDKATGNPAFNEKEQLDALRNKAREEYLARPEVIESKIKKESQLKNEHLAEIKKALGNRFDEFANELKAASQSDIYPLAKKWGVRPNAAASVKSLDVTTAAPPEPVKPVPEAVKPPVAPEPPPVAPKPVKAVETPKPTMPEVAPPETPKEARLRKIQDAAARAKAKAVPKVEAPAESAPTGEPEKPFSLSPKTGEGWLDAKGRHVTQEGGKGWRFRNMGIVPGEDPSVAFTRKGVAEAKEFMLNKMAKTDVQATNPKAMDDIWNNYTGKVATPAEDPFAQANKPGVGRSQTKKERDALMNVSYEKLDYVNKDLTRNQGLRPVKDSITGEDIPENIAHNAKVIFERLKKGQESGPPPTHETETMAGEIAKVQERYTPLLSDIASRMPTVFGYDTGHLPGIRTISAGVGHIAKIIRNKIGISYDNIRDVFPALAGHVTTMFQREGTLLNQFHSETAKLGRLARKSLLRSEFDQLDSANLSGDREKAMAVFKGRANEPELVAAYDANQAAKEAAREMMIASGRDVGYVENYFRRILLDREGLRAHLGKENNTLYDDAVAAATEAKGRPLTEEELTSEMNNLLFGSYRGKGLGMTKPRRVGEITKEMLKFYEPFDVADARWSSAVARDITNREFFGKIDPVAERRNPETGKMDPALGDLLSPESSFGAIFAKGVQSGAIKARGQKMLAESFRNLYNTGGHYNESMTKIAMGIRRMQTFAYLADVSTGLVQFADLSTILREYGVEGIRHTFGKNMPEIAGLGVSEGHNADVAEFTRAPFANIPGLKTIGKAYALTMKNVVGRADELLKSGMTRAANAAISKAFREKDSSFYRRKDAEYREEFPDRWDAMKKSLESDDFKNGKWDEHSSLFLYSELSKLQPINSAQRAEGFNTASPMGKVLYAMRSYSIKQVGIMRNQSYNEIKRGNILDGTLNGMSYLALVAVGQQALQYGKDKLLGRDVSVAESAAAGLMQLALIPRYAIYRARRVGPATAGIELAFPGIGIFNDSAADLLTIAKYFAKTRKADTSKEIGSVGDIFRNLEMVKYAPLVGHEIYPLFGKGKINQDKERARINAGGAPRPNVFQEIGNRIVPPDAKAR